MYTIFVDSDSDITLEECEKYGAKLISMPYTIKGKEYYPYVDWKEFDAHAFYDILRGGVLPTTSALSPVDYQKYFEPEFEKGNDILYIHFSEAMSGTFNAMRIGLEELQEKYPERKFLQIDTMAMTTLDYCQTIAILELLKEGKTPEEVAELWKTEYNKYAMYFYADNLKFFAKSGRVSGFAAFMGGMIGIKPLIHMNKNGVMESCGKGRGRMQTFQKIIDIVKETEEDIEKYPVYIGHSDILDLAKSFGQMLNEQFDNKLDIHYVVVNPTAGSHCGPDGLGVAFRSKGRK